MIAASSLLRGHIFSVVFFKQLNEVILESTIRCIDASCRDQFLQLWHLEASILDSDQDQLEHLVDIRGFIHHRKTAAEHLVLFCGVLEVQLYPQYISKPTSPPYAIFPTYAPVFEAPGLFHPSEVIVPHELGVPGWEVVPVQQV